MKRMLEDEKFEIAELGFRNIFPKVVWLLLTIRARAGLLNHSITKVKLLNNLIKVLKVYHTFVQVKVETVFSNYFLSFEAFLPSSRISRLV